MADIPPKYPALHRVCEDILTPSQDQLSDVLTAKQETIHKTFLVQELIAHYLYPKKNGVFCAKSTCDSKHPHRLTCMSGWNGCPAMAQVDKT